MNDNVDAMVSGGFKTENLSKRTEIFIGTLAFIAVEYGFIINVLIVVNDKINKYVWNYCNK